MDIEAILKKAGKFDEKDVRKLIEDIGYFDDEQDIDSQEDWEDDVVDDYANYIHNFLYTYKDIAQRVDPSIDPNQEHIGPMAQDIEKVNPACIKETKDGVKTVDTGRLAMMNAGAIADLARRVEALEKKLGGKKDA